MALTIKLTGTAEQVRELQAKPSRFIAALTNKLNGLMLRLQQKVQGKLSGAVLQPRTGNLLRSVRVILAKQEGTMLTAGVQAGSPEAPYGTYQEFGGTHAYDIFPVNKKALAFMMGGRMVVVKHVVHPPLPKRPFMQPSRDEIESEIDQGTKDAATEGLK